MGQVFAPGLFGCAPILLKNSDAALRQCAEAMRWRTIFSRHRLVRPAPPVLGGLIVEPSRAHAVLGAALAQSRVFQRNPP